MEENPKQERRGGKRIGVGRKKGINQKPMNFKVDLDNVEYLNTIGNKNALVNKLIKEHRESNESLLEKNKNCTKKGAFLK